MRACVCECVSIKKGQDMSKNNKSPIKATRKRIAKQQPNVYNTRTHKQYKEYICDTTRTRTLRKLPQYIGRCGAFPLPAFEHVAKNDVNISRGEHKIHHNISSAHTQTHTNTLSTHTDYKTHMIRMTIGACWYVHRTTPIPLFPLVHLQSAQCACV